LATQQAPAEITLNFYGEPVSGHQPVKQAKRSTARKAGAVHGSQEDVEIPGFRRSPHVQDKTAQVEKVCIGHGTEELLWSFQRQVTQPYRC
jgi:hypothetical protein